MSTPTMTSPLVGCTTIDSSPIPPDNGFLVNARAGNPGAGANGTTHAAAGNLSNCLHGLPPGVANIVGHGQEGDIDTGAAAGECITTANEDAWRDDLADLSGHVSELFLFGCSVGGGDAGAQLLHDIAVVINAPVSAPTGLIYCDAHGTFTLEAGAVWQTAGPGARPASIHPPVHRSAGHAMTKDSNAPEAAAGPEPVASGRISKASYAPSLKGVGAAPLNADTSLKLAAEVIWEKPFTPPGEPGAKVTGRLEVKFTGAPAPVTYTVYNHVLVRKDNSSTFYYTTPAFRLIATGQ